MPSHQESSLYSQHLCDHLFTSLKDVLGTSEVHRSKNWCSYSTMASPRFCFVRHNAEKIQVFLKAIESDGANLKSLLPGSRTVELVQRTNMTSDWAAITAYFVDVTGEQQIPEIVPMLVRVAHTVLERSTRMRPNDLWNSPSEIVSHGGSTTFWEGAQLAILINRYERNQRARRACIKKYGAMCSVCGFDFAERYGSIGAGFIHVHHLISLATIGKQYKLDPISDLRPVCPNCHEMLHRQDPPLSIKQLKARLLES